MQIFSFSPFGYEGALVTVEVDIRRGIPAVDIVGLADGAVKESRERMRAAVQNSGFDFPPERVLVRRSRLPSSKLEAEKIRFPIRLPSSSWENSNFREMCEACAPSTLPLPLPQLREFLNVSCRLRTKTKRVK